MKGHQPVSMEDMTLSLKIKMKIHKTLDDLILHEGLFYPFTVHGLK